jgi:hypothetical protein
MQRRNEENYINTKHEAYYYGNGNRDELAGHFNEQGSRLQEDIRQLKIEF